MRLYPTDLVQLGGPELTIGRTFSALWMRLHLRRGESCASWSRCRSSVHRMKAERIETLQIVRRVFLTFTRIIEANASSPSPIQTPTIVHNQLRGDVNCWDGPEPTAGMPVPEISVCPGTGSTSPPVLLEGCSTTPTASVGIPNWGRSVGSAFATRCASSAHTRMVSRRPGGCCGLPSTDSLEGI